MSDIDPTSQNRIAYDQIAARFAERNAEMLPYVVDAATRLLARIEACGRQDKLILDLGCGAGRDMAWLEAHGMTAVGADLSMGMLAEAQKRVLGGLLQLDMRRLAFPNQQFAAVWCQAALLHIPKAQAAGVLAEMARVLLEQGLLYVSTQRGDTEGFETRAYEPQERYYVHYQPEELAGVLRGAGFSVVDQGQGEARRPWIWALGMKN
jgi:ubiquinone/menaquinone biosynthesis C-methylase UbiE